MLVRTGQNRNVYRLFDPGQDRLEQLAALSALVTNAKVPAATTFRLAGTVTGTLPTSFAEIGPGWTTRRVVPASAATIGVARASGSDTGACVVEYLDTNWYHRSAIFSLASSPATVAIGGTGPQVGQTVTAWRVLSATYIGTASNVGQITVSIGADAQVTIGAGHRASQLMSWTVPRGQILFQTGYEVGVDATKVVSLRVVGGLIDIASGVVREIVRNDAAETNEHVAGAYRPEAPFGVTNSGVRQLAPLDISFLIKAGTATTATVAGVLRGVVMLDELHEDPEPIKIPWVAAEVARLAA